MDIERFEKILRDRAEQSIELNMGNKSWQKFNAIQNKNNSSKRVLVYLSAAMLIIIFSFTAGVIYSEYNNKNSTIKLKSGKEIMLSITESASVRNNSKNIETTSTNENIETNEALSALNSGFTGKNKTINNKSSNTSINAQIVKSKIKGETLNQYAESEIKNIKNENISNEEIIENINNDKGDNFQNINSIDKRLNNSDVENYTTHQLDKLKLKINHSSHRNMELKIEPQKISHTKQHQMYFGGLVFIKEQQQNYIGWRLGYYHEIKKNFRLFGSVYKVNDQVELETQIIPEHYPAPQSGLEIENILINKSTYVIPFGVNYTYPKFKIKPSISLGFAPEYAKVNKVKYKYKNTSDNIPEETKNVNIKTSNFYLYSDIGVQGTIYNNIEWKLSTHILNYLSGHEDGADNENNFKCYLNSGLIYNL